MRRDREQWPQAGGEGVLGGGGGCSVRGQSRGWLTGTGLCDGMKKMF